MHAHTHAQALPGVAVMKSEALGVGGNHFHGGLEQKEELETGEVFCLEARMKSPLNSPLLPPPHPFPPP